ncbi:MAG: divergent polysaccharide deacetylase family protein [Acidobacteriota bacterium]
MKAAPPAQERRRNPYPTRLYLLFILLGLLSSAGLDFRAARRGEKAYFFSFLAAREEPAAVPVPLTESARKYLEEAGVPADSVVQRKDKYGNPQFDVRMPLDGYTQLEPDLEKELRKLSASIKKTKKEEWDAFSFSWQVRGKEDEKLALVFSCPRPAPPKEEAAPPPPAESFVAIIIDDMGNSLEALQEISDLGQPITVSILPESEYARETAEIARESGLQVMLHLPGESLNHQEGNDSTDGLIRSGMSEEEVVGLVEASLGRVPHALGVNNHMGSKITQEDPVMRPILKFLKARDLFFVDSRTTSQSIAFDLAKKMGLRAAYRNVFLDSSVDVEFTRKQLTDLLKLAQRTGKAVGIGHPFPETLRALRENVHLFKKYKVKPVFASQIVAE